MGKVFELADGWGSELSVIAIISIVVITLFFAAKLGWLRLPGKNSKAKTMVRYNPHPPGEAKPCLEHGKKLERIETTIEIKFTEVGRRLTVLERKINNGRRE